MYAANSSFIYNSENTKYVTFHDSLDDTILVSACDFFSLWTYDIQNGDVLWFMSKVKRFSTIHVLSDFISPQDKPDFIDILKSSGGQLSQSRTIRLNVNGSYEWYSVIVTITSERTGIVFALNFNEETITSNKLNDVQEQIDLSLHQTNIV